MPTTPILNLPYPTGADSADVPRDIQALATAIDPLGHVPPGFMGMWPSGGAPPTGYLVCNGQQVPAATNPGLAALLGQVGGNVTLPDMRDLFPVGAGASYAVGATGGANSVTLSVAQMPSHNHTGLTGARDRSQAHVHSVGSGGQLFVLDIGGGLWTSGAGNRQGAGAPVQADSVDPPDHLHTITSQGGNGAHENRPPYRALQFIIRAG